MPRVKQNTLLLITGIIWLTASFILLARAYSWIEFLSSSQLKFATVLAVFLALIKIYLVFHKLNIKNIERIKSYRDPKISIWEFHILKDKLLILLMVAMGIALRHTPFIPKYALLPIYLGIGIAMFYVWILYLTNFIKTFRTVETYHW